MLTTIVIILATGVIWLAQRHVVASNREVVEELRQLRLSSRARVKTMSVQSGARTEEQELVRMGRATRAKRVVFGGDPEAPQFTNLGGTLPEGELR